MMLTLLLAAALGIPTGCRGAKNVLTYGDSKTVFTTGVSNNQSKWQVELQTIMGCGGTLNVGTSYWLGVIATNGITVGGRVLVLDADLAAVTTVPDLILFNLGSNDATGLPPEATWKANLATIWDAMHTKWPNAQIHYSLTWRKTYDSPSDTLAAWYPAVAAGRDYVHLCDDERVWGKAADDGAAMFWDGIHFSQAGSTLKARLAATCLGF